MSNDDAGGTHHVLQVFLNPQYRLSGALTMVMTMKLSDFFLLCSGDTSRVNSVLGAFYAGNASAISSAFNNITWSPETIRDYQNSLLDNRKYIEFCYGGPSVRRLQ